MPSLIPLDHPWIDATEAPLYEIRFPHQATDDEVIAFCAAREKWAEEARYPVAWVVDLAGIVTATAKQRRLFSEHLERFERHDVAYNRGSALVVPNAMIRGIVTAVFWLKMPRFPNECFPSRDLAFKWARQKLAVHSDDDPPGASGRR